MKGLIIEDKFDQADIYRKILNEENHICDIALNLNEVKIKLKQYMYDFALVDLNLPDGFGMDIIEDIKANNLNTHIIVITANISENQKINCLESGADDYLNKPVNYRELIARLNILDSKLNKYKEDVIKFDNLTVNLLHNEAYINEKKLKLSNIEYRILLYFIKNANRFISKEEILNSIYDEFSQNNYSSTFRVHIYNLKKKIMIESSNLKIINEKNNGYMLCIK